MTEDTARTVTIGEAATLLNVHRNTVRNRIKAGRYKAYKVVTAQGETYAIDVESIAKDVHHNPPIPSQPPVRHTTAQAAQPAQASAVVLVNQEAAVVRLVTHMLAPFVQELGQTKQELGRVLAERDQLHVERDELQRRAAIQDEAATFERDQIQAERDALEVRVRALEARQRSAQDTTALRAIQPDHTPETATQRPWWRFWKW